MSRLLDRILRDPLLASRLGPVESLPVIDAITHHPSPASSFGLELGDGGGQVCTRIHRGG